MGQDYDEETLRYYQAEEWAQDALADGSEEEPGGWGYRMRPEEVMAFAERAIAAAGWSGDGPALAVVFDLDHAWGDRSGYFSPGERVIHLDPRVVTPWTVLHEVAHFLDWRDGHGPRFVAIFYGLLRAAFGVDVAEGYLDQIEAEGCAVDWEWVETYRAT